MVLRRDIRAGLTVALVTLINSCAYASLLASGPLTDVLPTILASAFLATAIMTLVLARFHTLPSALGGPAGNAAAVVGAALSAVTVTDTVAAARSADVAVVLALSALLPGIVMLVLWRFRLGRAIRFVPYPVLAGFLAGTGWLLIVGATRIAVAAAPLAAAGAFAVVLRLAHARWKSPYILALAVLGGTVAAYAGLAIAHLPLDVARAQHWFYPARTAAGPAFLSVAAVQTAHWSAVLAAWSAFVWIVIVVVLVSMMNGANLEIESGIDTDVDRDLATLGAASVATGLLGGFGSQLVLPTSTLSAKLAPDSRVPGYIVSGVALLAVFAGSPIIAYLPTFVFAGLLAFIGVRFIEQYVIAGVRTMPRREASAVVAMLFCTALAGLAAALGLGLLITCVAFISSASRHAVIRRRLTLRSARSRVERSAAERRYLDLRGDDVEIIVLQGHLFFGSANALYEALKPSVESEPAHRAIVLDLALVHDIDLSAALSLAKLGGRARRRSVALRFAGVTPAFEHELRSSGAITANERVYAQLDDALESCETHLLADRDPGALASEDSALTGAGSDAIHAGRLRAYVERIELPDAGVLFSAGDAADALYVLSEGKLEVARDGVHLRTLTRGALVGEMGFFTGETRSATVTALGTVIVERLSQHALQRIEAGEPELLAGLQRTIMRLQADRLRSANAEAIAFHA